MEYAVNLCYSVLNRLIFLGYFLVRACKPARVPVAFYTISFVMQQKGKATEGREVTVSEEDKTLTVDAKTKNLASRLFTTSAKSIAVSDHNSESDSGKEN